METIIKPGFFNRHESMSSETRKEIMELTTELMITEDSYGSINRTIINYLYGSFDGYDYSARVLNSNDLLYMKSADLAIRLHKVFTTIKQYPRTEQPNGNEF